jgi:hypothetical protein
MMEQIAKLKELIAAAEAHAEKFFNKGNAAAGTRLRQSMQQLKTLAQTVRNDVTIRKRSK